MSIRAIARQGGLERAAMTTAVGAAGLRSTAAAVIIFGMIIAFCLLAERSRRKTVVSVLRDAPGGSVVIAGDTVSGVSLEVRVGEGRFRSKDQNTRRSQQPRSRR